MHLSIVLRRLERVFLTVRRMDSEIHMSKWRIESDNGSPFNSKEFNEFAEQEGFQHPRVTPLHPKANGEVKRFMQTLNKTEQITKLQGKNHLERRNVVQDMLIAYRSTPHPATGVAPYDALKWMSI